MIVYVLFEYLQLLGWFFEVISMGPIPISRSLKVLFLYSCMYCEKLLQNELLVHN